MGSIIINEEEGGELLFPNLVLILMIEMSIAVIIKPTKMESTQSTESSPLLIILLGVFERLNGDMHAHS